MRVLCCFLLVVLVFFVCFGFNNSTFLSIASQCLTVLSVVMMYVEWEIRCYLLVMASAFSTNYIFSFIHLIKTEIDAPSMHFVNFLNQLIRTVSDAY